MSKTFPQKAAWLGTQKARDYATHMEALAALHYDYAFGREGPRCLKCTGCMDMLDLPEQPVNCSECFVLLSYLKRDDQSASEASDSVRVIYEEFVDTEGFL